VCPQCQVGQRNLSALYRTDFDWRQQGLISVVEHVSRVPICREQPPVTPLSERDDRRKQVFSLFGQGVFMTLGIAGDWPTLKDSSVDEFFKPRRQKIAGNSNSLLEVIKATDAGKRLTQYEQTSPFSDLINRTRQRAIGVSPAISLHWDLLSKFVCDSNSYLTASSSVVRRSGWLWLLDCFVE
jgi:hypothetical protein